MRARLRQLRGPDGRGDRLLHLTRPRAPPRQRALALPARSSSRTDRTGPSRPSSWIDPSSSTSCARRSAAGRRSSSRGTSPDARSRGRRSASAHRSTGPHRSCGRSGFKSAGRKLFRDAGVPTPFGRGRALSMTSSRTRSPPSVTSGLAPGVVIKLDDSGAGDGNMVGRARPATSGASSTRCLTGTSTSCSRRGRRGADRRRAVHEPERAGRDHPRARWSCSPRTSR